MDGATDPPPVDTWVVGAPARPVARGGGLPAQRVAGRLGSVALAWPDGVASFRTAAGIRGLPVSAGDQVHVRLATFRRTPGVAFHGAALKAGEVDYLDEGLAVTSWLRTVGDCLASCDLDEALDLYAWLATREKLTRGAFGSLVRARFGRPGVSQLLLLARITRSGAVSAAENRLHKLRQARGITGWEANAQVCDVRGLIGRVDLLFRRERIVIEVDGERDHTKRRAFVTDRRRQNRVVIAGYTVLRYTWWDIVERPDDVVAEIRKALEIAAS